MHGQRACAIGPTLHGPVAPFLDVKLEALTRAGDFSTAYQAVCLVILLYVGRGLPDRILTLMYMRSTGPSSASPDRIEIAISLIEIYFSWLEVVAGGAGTATSGRPSLNLMPPTNASRHEGHTYTVYSSRYIPIVLVVLPTERGREGETMSRPDNSVMVCSLTSFSVLLTLLPGSNSGNNYVVKPVVAIVGSTYYAPKIRLCILGTQHARL